MKRSLIAVAFIFLVACAVQCQPNYLVTSRSAGKIKLGMTVAQARKAMKGFKLKRTSDGDGAALIEVSQDGKEIMTLYAGEEDPKARINERAKIEEINVWDRRYRTVDGIHPKMLVKTAERKLGKVKQVFMSEIESREYAEFSRKPKGLLFRIDVDPSGSYLTAGIYKNNERNGTRYAPNAMIIGIQVSAYFD